MESPNKLQQPRYALIAAGIFLLAMVYLFQQTDYLNGMIHLVAPDSSAGPFITFAVNKTLRLIVNDALCILLIWGLFAERRYLRIAFAVFCVELLIILPVYLIVKLSLEGSSEISSPLLSQIHRLIVNPMLMLVLIAGLYYQRSREAKKA